MFGIIMRRSCACVSFKNSLVCFHDFFVFTQHLAVSCFKGRMWQRRRKKEGQRWRRRRRWRQRGGKPLNKVSSVCAIFTHYCFAALFFFSVFVYIPYCADIAFIAFLSVRVCQKHSFHV